MQRQLREPSNLVSDLSLSTGEWGRTYCATTWACDSVVVERSTAVLALVADIAGNLDVEVKYAIWVCGCVLEEGDVGHAAWALADTKVNWSPVAQVGADLVPTASILNWRSRWVDVVLSGGEGSAPAVVVAGIRAGQLVFSTWLGVEWDSLGFSARIIGTADGDVLAEGVLDLGLSGTLDAELARESCVGNLKLAVAVTVDTANRLASVALGRWPLGLLIAGRAGI